MGIFQLIMDKRIQDVATKAFGSFDLAKVRLQDRETRAAPITKECTRIINELIGQVKTETGRCDIAFRVLLGLRPMPRERTRDTGIQGDNIIDVRW